MIVITSIQLVVVIVVSLLYPDILGDMASGGYTSPVEDEETVVVEEVPVEQPSGSDGTPTPPLTQEEVEEAIVKKKVYLSLELQLDTVWPKEDGFKTTVIDVMTDRHEAKETKKQCLNDLLSAMTKYEMAKKKHAELEKAFKTANEPSAKAKAEAKRDEDRAIREAEMTLSMRPNGQDAFEMTIQGTNNMKLVKYKALRTLMPKLQNNEAGTKKELEKWRFFFGDVEIDCEAGTHKKTAILYGLKQGSVVRMVKN